MLDERCCCAWLLHTILIHHMATERRKWAIELTTDAPPIPGPTMGLSFPCVGYLDDGVFDLGLEADDDERKLCRSTNGPDSHPCPPPMALSPDALDLALLKLSAATDADNDWGSVAVQQQRKVEASQLSCDDHGHDLLQNSPFCDAKVSGINRRSSTRSGPHGGLMGNKQSRAEPSLELPIMSPRTHQQRRESTQELSGGNDFSAGTSSSRTSQQLMGSATPSTTFNRAHTFTIPPAFAGNHASNKRPSTTFEKHRPRELRDSNESRRLVRQQLLDRSLVDANAASRWAKLTEETCEAVTSSVGKEEKALAAVNTPPYSSSGEDSTKERQKDCIKYETDRRVSFAVDLEGNAGPSAPDNDEWEDTSEMEMNDEEDDLVARASDLHSSVAGQLRSVNELLKRKSYFYIDTSWRAKQLPCSPTAWKGKQLGSSSNGKDVRTENDVTSGNAATSVGRSPSQIASNVNIDARLEGQWISAIKRRRVAMYSIPGEKVWLLSMLPNHPRTVLNCRTFDIAVTSCTLAICDERHHFW